MYFVYLIRSQKYPKLVYTGYTENLQERVQNHNAGGTPSTAHAKPWNLVFYCAFMEKAQALDFELYLKSHAGRTFAKKRLVNATQ